MYSITDTKKNWTFILITFDFFSFKKNYKMLFSRFLFKKKNAVFWKRNKVKLIFRDELPGTNFKFGLLFKKKLQNIIENPICTFVDEGFLHTLL